jgi:hypothetical protein
MTQQQWNMQPSGDDDVQMPLGLNSESNGEYIPTGEGKPKVGGSTLALVGAFALGLAVIYGLGMHAKPRAASAETLARQQLVQSAITELLEKNGKAEQVQGLFRDTDKLVAMFYSYLGTDTATRPALPHDPFANDEARAVAITPSNPNAEAVAIVTTNAAEAEKLRKVAETFNSLKLQTVMLGRKPAAMINNTMLTVGNKIGEFTVADIQNDRVLLTYNASKFELKLNRSNGQPQ